MNNETSISVVNGLIESTMDSANGYDEAAKAATNARFKTLFTSRSAERMKITRTLQAEVTRLGGTPETDGTVLGSAHRMFLNLKNAVTGSDKSVVDEVEAGEDSIKAAYEKAMKNADLDAATMAVITTAYGSVKADHDQMREIKHDMHAA